MTLTTEEIAHNVMACGEGDSARDTQFLVVYHDSGKTCDVILLSNCDNGIGVSASYRDVPYSLVDAWICGDKMRSLSAPAIKRGLVAELEELYK